MARTESHPPAADSNMASDDGHDCTQPEDQYEPTAGTDLTRLEADSATGPIIEGVVKPVDPLAVIARHVTGLADQVSLAIDDNGVTFTTQAKRNGVAFNGRLARKDFTAQLRLSDSGIVEVPTDDLLDALRFVDDEACLLEVTASTDDTAQLALRLDDGDRFAGIDLPTDGDGKRLDKPGVLPDVQLPVAATVHSATPIGELASAHTQTTVSDYEAPTRPYMTADTRKYRRNADIAPSVIVTASAPRADDGATETTSGGEHRIEGAVVTFESVADGVDPVVYEQTAGATTADGRLAGFDAVATERVSFEATGPDGDQPVGAVEEWLPVFDSDRVAAAHAGNEVLAQTGVDATYLKGLFGKPTKRQLDAMQTVAFGTMHPVKFKRTFRGGGYVRCYVAPRKVLP